MRRRIPALLLAVLMLMSAAAGESALRGYNKEDGYVYLRLGQYPQTEDGGIEPILWRVLTVDDEKAYLLSEYILFARAKRMYSLSRYAFSSSTVSTRQRIGSIPPSSVCGYCPRCR